MSSIGHHVQVLIGNAEPLPFPIVRYWAEYSAKDFRDNILAVPLVGVPGIVPIGYIGDLCIDSFFSPIDLLLCYLSTGPNITVEQQADGRNIVYVRSTTAQMHHDKAFINGTIPLTINTEKGFLKIQIKSSSSVITFDIFSKEIKHCYMDYYGRIQRKTYSNDFKLLTLWCFPANTEMPVPLLLYILNPKDTSPSVCFSFRNEQINLPYRGSRISLYNEKICTVTITPSPDFVGECSYNGMAVSEVKFIYD